MAYVEGILILQAPLWFKAVFSKQGSAKHRQGFREKLSNK